MKKVPGIMFFLLPIIVLSSEIPLAENINIFPSPNILTSPGFDTVEIKSDEGMKWNYGLILAAGDRMAVKLTPEQYPVTLVQAAYWPLTWEGWPDSWAASCNLIFYADGDVPEIELGRMDDVAAEYAGWFNWFDVSELDITIEEGSFFLAVEYTHDSVPGLAIDMGSPVHHASWIYNVGTGWRSWDTVDVDVLPVPMGDSLDLMLRVKALVEDTTTRIVEMKPDKSQLTEITYVTESDICYIVPEGGQVEFSLWDPTGRLLKTIYKGYTEPGQNRLYWDGTYISSGIYFVSLEYRHSFKVRRLMVN